ncbi:hypothetical protein Dsin_031024 [Dipteronia sinensis]|uniref:Transposase n=1 Tax=Dipteronia sinensis TaxID=43782 RepID=A0AAE0DRT9_9ROSI|nr:hypothetical protein Dsin_031024 [Dipteronia sinensis]
MLKDAFLMCNKLPTSHYEAKKIIKDLGLHYEKIDACDNDCIIYYKEYGEALECPVCRLPRWQPKGKSRKGKNVPWKVKTTGIEPSPIECFKMFHMSKTKNSGKEWTSEQTEALHAKLEAKIAVAQDQGFEIDELNIYHEVVGKASHGRVLGMGSCIKAKDVYGCCEGSSKLPRVDKTEELELKIKNMEEELQQYKAMKDELEQLKATQEEVKQMHEFMKVIMSQSNIQLPPTPVCIVFPRIIC